MTETSPTPKPAMTRPTIKTWMIRAPACIAIPTEKMTQVIMIPHLRPTLSQMNGAVRAPQNVPIERILMNKPRTAVINPGLPSGSCGVPKSLAKLCMSRSWPPIIQSYPNRKPPKATNAMRRKTRAFDTPG